MTTTVSERVPDPCALIIFGASGDLTRRKLVPAIWHLQEQNRLPAAFALVGVARRDWDDDYFRQQMREGIAEFVGEVDQRALDAFLARLHTSAATRPTQPPTPHSKPVWKRSTPNAAPVATVATTVRCPRRSTAK